LATCAGHAAVVRFRAAGPLRYPSAFDLVNGLPDTMKKLLSVLVCTYVAWMAGPAFAQTSDSALLLAKVQADKKAVVEKSLNLTAEEAKKFWPLYDKFQKELAAPHREYALAVRDYVGAEKSMTDANATRLARVVLAASVSEAKIRERQFKEASKVLPGVKAARYVQIENKIQAVQRYETAKAIPLAE
jgi:hypothetical protein